MEIPPPGSDPQATAEFVDRLVRESADDPRRKSFEEDAERGYNLHLGNHWVNADNNEVIRLVLNRIQNCVISIVAIQAGDPPSITFTPRESGDPPLVYLNTKLPEAQELATELAAQMPNPDGTPWDPADPLPDALADHLRAAVDQSQQLAGQAEAAGQPPPPSLLPADLLVEVTDATSCQALQTVFDGMWEGCDAQYTFAENILNKNVLGWQPTLVEFDDVNKQQVLTNVHPFQVFVDPITTDTKASAYVIYDQPIGSDEAKKKWPQFTKEIELIANEGTVHWVGYRTYRPASVYLQHFYRNMVVVRTAWLRHQQYPMSPQQARAAGQIVTKQIPTGPATFHSANDYGVACPECGTAYQQGVLTPADNCPSCGTALGSAPTREAHFPAGAGAANFDPATSPEITQQIPHPETGAAMDNPAWPMRYGIRQVTCVANAAVEDKECEAVDIPIAANRNVPIPFSPYGQGEPKRLEGIQLAINRILSAMVTHHAYNAFAPELICSEVAERLDASVRDAKTKPNQRIEIPASVRQAIGNDLKNAIVTLDPATMPADFWKLLDLLLSLIDKEGNQADVMQGNAQPGWSGEVVKSLQNAASQVIRGKSMFTEFYLKRLARLMVGNIIRRMTPADLAKYLSHLPIQAIEAVQRRVKSLDVDISVQIRSGSGGAKDQRTSTLMAAKQQGVPVSDPTIMKELDLDPDTERTLQADWMRKQQAMAAPPPGQQIAPQQTGPVSNNGAMPAMSAEAQPVQQAAA